MGKLTKRVIAIMCIFMMVTVVEAVDTNGKVTVTNVKLGETYKIFKILTLESFDETKGAYSYIRNGDAWDGFINSSAAKKYIETLFLSKLLL